MGSTAYHGVTENSTAAPPQGRAALLIYGVWMADEAHENATQWTPNQREYITWLALPSRLREPLTQEMLAAEMGVNASTLWRWQKLPGFQQELERLIRESMKGPLNEVVGSFLDEAKKGSFQHALAYFQMIGWHTPAQRVEGDITVKVTRMNMDDV